MPSPSKPSMANWANHREALMANPPIHTELQVTFTNKSIVKATNHSPEPRVLHLSNLDLLSGRFPITYFYFYRRPTANSSAAIIDALKTSLAETLTHYYPFAGTILQNLTTNEPEILCDNSGALVVEAEANLRLNAFNFYDLDELLRGKLVTVNPDFALQIQITSYACGGVSITFTFDHALGDASAFGKFLLAWSEIARGKPISTIPDHRRNILPRSPPIYHPDLDDTMVKCTMEEIKNIPTLKKLIKRLYYVDRTSIDKLQKLASSSGVKRTKIEAFSAYVWKIMVSAMETEHSRCKMGWLIDGRSRLGGDWNYMSDYIGNVLSVAFGEGSIEELKRNSISEIADVVHSAISKATNKAHFLDLIDWIECHRPGLMLSRIVLGLGGPGLVVSSGRKFPVAELDFGFGSPVLGTVGSTIERIGVSYLNQRPSAKGDGSWTVSAILEPELAAALELDSVFQPMTATLLQL
ncbi:fatty alcohol:caffeoyl-CoA acyltransferase [Cucurbita moschata]|uniref:Fatty alcohol:caffeoyl-CoA acyltransferase n=1 Tax=Cucurbita moschata TaxID=3662 RepID=A0A6J1EXZ8_CUCMO|nr:fatty alcohol:caffeoyl-CoA acyltransferase [Cucurbita moschata]